MISESRIERRLNFTQRILLATMVIIIGVPFAVTYWIARQYPSVSTVTVTNLALASPAPLCPGDVLTYTYDFHAEGAGVLVRDRTVWQIDPPRTVIYSDNRRFILTDAIDQTLTEAWHIPVEYVNPAIDAADRLPPGRYGLRLAISSPSKSTIVAIQTVDFEIGEDCS